MCRMMLNDMQKILDNQKCRPLKPGPCAITLHQPDRQNSGLRTVPKDRMNTVNIDTTLDQGGAMLCAEFDNDDLKRGAHWAHKDEGRIQPSVFAAGPPVLGHTLGSLQRAPHGSIQLATASIFAGLRPHKAHASDTSDGKR